MPKQPSLYDPEVRAPSQAVQSEGCGFADRLESARNDASLINMDEGIFPLNLWSMF